MSKTFLYSAAAAGLGAALFTMHVAPRLPANPVTGGRFAGYANPILGAAAGLFVLSLVK